MEKETKHTPETHLEISEGAMYGYRVYKVIDATDPKNRIIFCDCHLEESYAKLIVESVNSAPTLKAELSEMKAAYEKDANKLMDERDRFKNLCDEKDKVIEDYSCNLKPVNELKAEIEKHMRELSEMKKEREELVNCFKDILEGVNQVPENFIHSWITQKATNAIDRIKK